MPQFREKRMAPKQVIPPFELLTPDCFIYKLTTGRVLSLPLSLGLSHPPAPTPSSSPAASALPLSGWRANSEQGEEQRFVNSPCPGSWLSPSGRRSSRSGRTGGSSSAAPALCTRRGVEHFLTEKAVKGQLKTLTDEPNPDEPRDDKFKYTERSWSYPGGQCRCGHDQQHFVRPEGCVMPRSGLEEAAVDKLALVSNEHTGS